MFSSGDNHTAPAVNVKLLVTQIIFQPGRKRKEVDKSWCSQTQASKVLPYPQATQVLQAPHISCQTKKLSNYRWSAHFCWQQVVSSSYFECGRFLATVSAPAVCPLVWCRRRRGQCSQAWCAPPGQISASARILLSPHRTRKEREMWQSIWNFVE